MVYVILTVKQFQTMKIVNYVLETAGNIGTEKENVTVDNEQISTEKFDSIGDEPLKDRLKKLDGIWESKSRLSEDVPFTANSGPNVPKSVTSPLNIFHCLFTTEIIDILVNQTNLYQEQKQSF